MQCTRITTLLAFLFVPLTVQAQGQADRSPRGATIKTEGRSSEAEIRQWLDRFAKAFRAHDVNAVMALYAPTVVAYDLTPPLQYVGAAAYRKNYEAFFAQYTGPIDTELRDVHIVAGGDVAFATALERISGTLTNGQKSDGWVRVTSGFRKVNGRWLDVHDHISVPTDMESGKAVLDLKP